MRHLIVVCFLVFAAISVHAQTAAELYAKGNRLKTDKKYDGFLNFYWAAQAIFSFQLY